VLEQTNKNKRRPREVNQYTARIVGEATGERRREETADQTSAPVVLGRQGVKKGISSRAAKAGLTKPPDSR
jgi:hypothetical protein